jgi:type II secretory pathway component PulC
MARHGRSISVRRGPTARAATAAGLHEPHRSTTSVPTGRVPATVTGPLVPAYPRSADATAAGARVAAPSGPAPRIVPQPRPSGAPPPPFVAAIAARVTTTPMLVTVVAAVAIVLQAGWSVRGWLAAGIHRTPAVSTTAVVPGRADALALASLFGRAAPSPEAAAAEAGDLELSGTIALADPRAGFGILRRKGQGDQLYRAGVALPGGARLVEVYAACVIIETGGSPARLCLPHTGIAAPLVAVAPRGPRPRDPVVEASPPVPQTLEERRAHPVNVPSTPVTEALRPRPMVVDEHVVGYAVSSAEDTSPIEGLPRMAIIRSINGVSLTDGVVAARMFDSLPASAEATFVIQTPAGERTLTLDVRSLAALAQRTPESP